MSIEERIIELVARQSGEPREMIHRETTFAALNFDSLDSVELTMDIEEEFGIGVPDADAAKIKTVGEAIDYVTGKVEKR